MSFHNSLTGTDIHVSHAFTYANAAARTGATVASTDIGKFALQSDTGRFYVLLNNSPVTWSQISNLDQVTTDSTTTGSAASLQSTDINYGVVRLTNGSLVSVGNIPAGSAGQSLVVENQTGAAFNVLDNNGATTTSIRTGTGSAVQIQPNSTITFLYDATAARWMLVGGSGSGGLSAWQASTAYNSGQVVTNGKIAYSALESFTSGSLFSADLFNGYWQQLNLPALGRNYAQTGNNFEDNTAGGWQLFTLQTQYTFTVSALSAAVPVGATFSNNSQIFTATTAAASGATTLITSGTGLPTGGSTSLTSTTWTFTVSALANAVPVGAVYSNNGHNYTVLQAAAAGATTLVTTTQTIGATQTGTTLTWVSGAIPGMLAAPGNITFSAETNDTTVPSTITVSSNVSAAYSAGAVPSTFPTLGSASSMSLAASNPGISGQYSLLVGNTLGNNLTAGQGVVSPIFSVDQVDQAKMLQNVLSYMATGGDASYLSFTGTSAGTWALYIQDVTNGAWIQPAGVYNFVQGTTTLAGKSTSTWQTPSNLVFFRVALLCLNTTAATIPGADAIATYFDDLYVGPQTAPSGPVVADWTAYTPTVVGGTTSLNQAYWRRVGDSMEINQALDWSSSVSTIISVSLPTGYTIDTTKLGAGANQTLGVASGTTFGGIGYDGFVAPNGSTTTVGFFGQAATGAWSSTTPFTWASGSHLRSLFTVPIVGWSSNTSMSSDTDTRVVAMRATASGTPGGTLGATASTIIYNTANSDTHGAYNSSSGIYAVPVSGYYDICGGAGFTASTLTSPVILTLSVYNNTTSTTITSTDYVIPATLSGLTQALATNIKSVYLTAGTQISIAGNYSTAYGGTITGPAYANGPIGQTCYFSVSRQSGPAVVAATESVAASYSGTSSVIAAANTWNAVACTTRNYDTHSEYNTSTGAYTVPVSGKYRVTVSSGFTSISGAVTEGFFVGIGHNSSTSPSAQNGVLATTTSSNTYYCQCSQTIACVTGDTLYGLVQQSMNGSTNLVLQTAAAISYICIERVGN